MQPLKVLSPLPRQPVGARHHGESEHARSTPCKAWTKKNTPSTLNFSVIVTGCPGRGREKAGTKAAGKTGYDGGANFTAMRAGSFDSVLTTCPEQTTLEVMR
jgi:hypothetical protein